jgi:hypothetical protein
VSFLKLVVSFAPWIAFLVIAGDTMRSLEVGLIVALTLSVVMAVLRLNRGIIMWVGVVFFAVVTVAVLGFHNIWTITNLGVLANGALAVAAWAGLIVGRPFTLAYARQDTDPALWNNPVFIRTNVRITVVWATAFTISTAMAWVRIEHLLPGWLCHSISYAGLLAAAVFTSWYPAHVRRTAPTGVDGATESSPEP